jgi:hypothetical protein
LVSLGLVCQIGITQGATGKTYNIYPDPQKPQVDLFSQLKTWFAILEHHGYKRPLKPDDHIFPTLTSAGELKIDSEASHDTILNLIREVTHAANVAPSAGKFSSHSYRRGGCQHKFTYADVGERWSLIMVRWWGGWAEGENVRFPFLVANHDSSSCLCGWLQRLTLMRYILDDVDDMEADFRDARRPAAVDPEEGLRGEAQLLSHPTFNDMHNAINTAVDNVHTLFKGTVTSEFAEMRTMLGLHPHSSTLPTDHRASTSASTTPLHATAPKPAVRCFVGYVPPNTEPVQTSGTTGTIQARIAIPKVHKEVPLEERWKEWVRQWEHPSPDQGNDVALKDWEPEWYSGPELKFSVLYRQRQLIATEFIDV